MAVINNPEPGYLSGEVRVDVRANENPIIRLGLAQNGVTLVEFPATDRFFALHPGNIELVTIDDSPTKATDHFFVMRAGQSFLPVPPGVKADGPAASVVVQMQSGMIVTFLLYPVRDLAQNAHRCVINYNRGAIVAARRAMGLAVNLSGEEKPDVKVETTSIRIAPAEENTVPKDEKNTPAPRLEPPVVSVPSEARLQPVAGATGSSAPAPTPTPRVVGEKVETTVAEPVIPPVVRSEVQLPREARQTAPAILQTSAVQNLAPNKSLVSVSEAPVPPPPESAGSAPAAKSTLTEAIKSPSAKKSKASVAVSESSLASKNSARAKKDERADGLTANWSKPVHGLSVAAETGVIDAERRVLYVAIKNTLATPVRIVPGQPELLVGTLDEKGKVLQVEPVRRLGVESSTSDGMIAPGATATYVIAYEAPILGARQRFSVAVAQTNAADEPALVDLVPGKR